MQHVPPDLRVLEIGFTVPHKHLRDVSGKTASMFYVPPSVDGKGFVEVRVKIPKADPTDRAAWLNIAAQTEEVLGKLIRVRRAGEIEAVSASSQPLGDHSAQRPFQG